MRRLASQPRSVRYGIPRRMRAQHQTTMTVRVRKSNRGMNNQSINQQSKQNNDKPRPSPPEGDMRHQATVSGPPAASSRRLLVRFRDWSKREAAGTRSENARGSTRRARASSDRREHGQLLPTAQATPPRLPLLFSWARGRLPCVCVPTCPTLAKCALKALGAFFTESVHARFLGCYVVVTNPSPSRCCATMARAVAADSSAR